MNTLRILIIMVSMIPSLAIAQDYSVWLERCDPYRNQVEQILRNEGVSTDYYYLMVAESKCTPKATSKAGAKGFWQLMPSTAKHYGCFHLDDVECATKAAAGYIKSLEKRFTSFREVIAAYNMGGHNYQRAGKMTAEAYGLIARVFAIKRRDENG